jgi:hypothetical protein
MLLAALPPQLLPRRGISRLGSTPGLCAFFVHASIISAQTSPEASTRASPDASLPVKAIATVSRAERAASTALRVSTQRHRTSLARLTKVRPPPFGSRRRLGLIRCMRLPLARHRFAAPCTSQPGCWRRPGFACLAGREASVVRTADIARPPIPEHRGEPHLWPRCVPLMPRCARCRARRPWASPLLTHAQGRMP